MAYSTVQCPFEGIEVLHAVAGRIRLRATGTDADAQLEDLAKFLQRKPNIKQVKTNQQTGSLTVLFDSHQLPMQQLLNFLAKEGVTIAQTSSNPTTLPDPLEQVSAILSGASLDVAMPLMAGLLVVQRLGIQGLPALPLYLIVAESTRQVMDEYGSIGQPQPTPAEFSPEPPVDNHFKIVHAVAGRIRFQIPRMVDDEIYRRRIKRAIEAMPEVTGIKINKAVASFAVTYDPSAVSLPQMQQQLVSQLQQGTVPVSIQVPGAKPKNPASATVTYKKPQAAPKEPALIGVTNRQIEAVSGPVNSKPSVVAFSTPPASRKPTAWDDYKPPALSIFLRFMANLY